MALTGKLGILDSWWFMRGGDQRFPSWEVQP